MASGATFEGNLVLASGGTPKNPVVIRSEGKPAIIVAKTSAAIEVRAGGFEIRDLKLVGDAKVALDHHDGLLLNALGNQRLTHVEVERLDISGFGGAGIAMSAPEGSLNGFDDVKISHSTVHGNYGTGIVTGDGVSAAAKGFAHRGLVITDCNVSDNLGGNGVILSGVDGATVEYCVATGNRGPEGALGMWAWCAKNVTFRYNIANGTRGKGDGGGYDLDGGCVDCVIEHCLSFDNDGPGYMHCDFPEAPRTHNNVIRDSISIDDGRKAVGEPSGFGFVVWGTGLYDCTVERNLAVLTKDDPEKRENGVLFATFIRMDKLRLSAQRLQGAIFKNNVVEIEGEGASFFRSNFPSKEQGQYSFRGNDYRSKITPPFIEGPNGEHRFATVAQWRAATGDTLEDMHKARSIALDRYQKLKPRDLPKFFKRLGR